MRLLKMIDRLVILLDNFLNKNISKVKNLNRLIAVVCMVFLIQVFNQEEISYALDLNFLVSIFLIFIGYLFQTISWSYIISEKPNIKTLSSWLTSIIGKYLPLKIGIPILRITDDLNTNNPNSRKYLNGVLIEVFFQLTSGIFFTGLYIFSQIISVNYFICFAFYLILLYSGFLFYKNQYFLVYIFNSITYLLYLFAVIYFGSILYGEVIIELGLAYIFSAIISLIFVGSPAGIGVREYFFILLFQDTIALASVNFIEFLILMRLIFIFADLFSYSVGKIIKFLNT